MKTKLTALLLCAVLLLTACTSPPAATTTPTTTAPPETTTAPPENTAAPSNIISFGDVEFCVLPGMSMGELTDDYAVVDIVPGQAIATVFAIDASKMDSATLAGALTLFKMKFADLNDIHYGDMSVVFPIVNYDVTFDYYAIDTGNENLRYNLLGAFSDTYTLYVIKYACVDGEMALDDCSEAFGRFLSGATSSSIHPRFDIVENDESKLLGLASLISNASTDESNAAKKALQYLDVSAFSYTGLIEQLKYEGFTNQEAAFGANACGANWYAQAAIKAAAYLDISAFSRSGLIEQLEYEGFTHEQAVYGAEQNGY